MILQALAEYYERKAADPKAEMATDGFEWKEMPFVLTLKPDGTPVSLNSTYEGEGRDRRAKRFLIPLAVKRTVAIKANLLWDNPEYALGIDLKGKPDRVKKQHAAFIQRIDELGDIDDPGLLCVRHFLDSDDKAQMLEEFGAWEELCESGGNISFALAGEKGLIAERSAIQDAIKDNDLIPAAAETGICLISGESQPIQRLHAAIKGVRGAQSTGANIVSLNLAPFCSHNKEQGANSPIGGAAAFAYTTGLNHLLGKDSRQKMQVGDASTVFWAERPATLEGGFLSLFGEPPKGNPDEGVDAVAGLFKSVENGAFPEDEATNRFYVLGLAPNAARIAVRFWVVDTVAGMSGKIVQHFKDLSIAHGPRDRDSLPLFRLLVSTASLGKSENIPPNLAGDTMRAILTGQRYPQTLLQAAVRRNRAEQSVTYARAMLIKACLNRKTRFDNPQEKEELKVSLDTGNKNIGYRLGRLFAALEKIQGEANPGLNATIRDRFYGAASGTPIAVFSNLMRLKNHHLSKLDSPGRRVTFEKLIAEILSNVDGQIGFPPTLSMPDQGRFAIGYYHQTQDFYTKKEKPANTDSKEEGNDNE